MGNEVELKLRVVKEDSLLSRIEEAFSIKTAAKDLRNVYYDTPDLALNKSKIALRIRYTGDRFIQTLKTKGQAVDGLHQRGEWEWELASDKLDHEKLADCGAWPRDIDLDQLRPVFETNFNRHMAILKHKDSVVELAIDIGQVLSDGKVDEMSEIELELVKGDSSHLLELGDKIGQVLSVETSDISKAERGYALFHAS